MKMRSTARQLLFSAICSTPVSVKRAVLSLANPTAALLALLLLSSCGFQLRGSQVLLDQYSTVFVQSERDSDFVKALRRALLVRGVQVTRLADEAAAQLTIVEDTSGQRILSVAATDGPEEYEVFQTTVFTLRSNGETLIESQSITLTRDYTYDKNEMLGKRHEYESLRKALAESMAQTILRRMQYAL